MSSFDYPVWLDLHEVPCSSSAQVPSPPARSRASSRRRCRGARRRTSVAPALDRATVVELHERRYEPGDLEGVRLVVTATGDAEVDAVAADATAAGIWVNAADQPADCSFILPAIARNGPLSIAVSTGGSSPALARRLRDRASALLTDDVVALAGDLAARRAACRRRLDRGRRLVGPDRPGATALTPHGYIRPFRRTEQYQGGTNREDEGRNPVGERTRPGASRTSSSTTQGRRGARPDGRLGAVPLRRPRRHR